jgi:hypothetical protein
MFESKTNPGRKFGSRFRANKFDAMHAGDEDTAPKQRMSEAHEAAETPEFEAGEKEGAEEVQKQESPKQVVAQHGKATSTHVHSDHTTGKHHVVSHHADGYMHQSDYNTPEDAHDAAKQLGGGTEMEAGDMPSAESAPAMPAQSSMPRFA